MTMHIVRLPIGRGVAVDGKVNPIYVAFIQAHLKQLTLTQGEAR